MVSTSLTLAPLVCEQWWWLSVGRLDPRRKETSLVCLIPQVLVQVCVSDLLQRFHIVHRDQVAVQVHELNANLTSHTITEYQQLNSTATYIRHWKLKPQRANVKEI